MNLISSFLAVEVFGGVIVAFITLYLYFKFVLYNYWQKNGVIFMEPSIPTGNIYKSITGKEHMGECFANAYDKLKKNRYFGMYTFHKPTLVIADPDLLKVVMTKEFTHFHDRGIYCNEEIDPLSGTLFLLPGEKWKKLRVKLSPTFTSGKMKQMFGIVKEKGDVLAQFLEEKAKNREVVEMKDVIARYGTDVIFSTAFGVDCNSLHNPECEFRHWGRRSFEMGSVKNAFAFFAPKILQFFRIPLMEKGITQFFTKVFKDTVEYRTASNIRRKDFLDLLIQLINTGRIEGDDKETFQELIDGKISLMEAAAQAFVFFLAGFETSSTTVSHCLYELSIHPEIQEKVHEEIETVLKKHGDITYDSLQDMKYLHKCVNETMRKYPPLAFLNRVCTKDIDLHTTNLRVSKGVDIVIPVLGIHMDPEIYPNPMKFDPERFTEENIANRHPYTYLPFGEGPRICIGMRFGYAQTKIALISILKKFRVTLGPNTPVPLKIDKDASFIYSAKEINLRIESLD